MNLRTFFVFLFPLVLQSTALVASEEIVLFDGTGLEGWSARKGGKPEWKVENGYLEVVPGKGDIQTNRTFGDFHLHAEFWIPLLVDKHGQDRSNSGIFLQGRYEIQVLDSYENPTYFAGSCGSLYKILEAKGNASLPPEHWQTYDLTFRAPRLDSQSLVKEPGHLTVVQNGIKVIDGGRFDQPTGSAFAEKQGVPGPIRLQDHGNVVRFRNIRITPLDGN